MSTTSPAAASGVSHVRTRKSGGMTNARPASPSAIPANSRRLVGISTMYFIPPGDGRSMTKAWKTKKRPSNTCRTHRAMFIYCPQTDSALHLFVHQSIAWRKGTLALMSETFVPGLRYPSRAHEMWALVVESFRGWEERVNEAAAAVGLSPVSAWALVQLDPDNPISQKELEARLP